MKTVYYMPHNIDWVDGASSSSQREMAYFLSKFDIVVFSINTLDVNYIDRIVHYTVAINKFVEFFLVVTIVDDNSYIVPSIAMSTTVNGLAFKVGDNISRSTMINNSLGAKSYNLKVMWLDDKFSDQVLSIKIPTFNATGDSLALSMYDYILMDKTLPANDLDAKSYLYEELSTHQYNYNYNLLNHGRIYRVIKDNFKTGNWQLYRDISAFWGHSLFCVSPITMPGNELSLIYSLSSEYDSEDVLDYKHEEKFKIRRSDGVYLLYDNSTKLLSVGVD